MLNWAHWKTTLAGVIIAVLQVIANGRDGKTIATAALTAILGVIAKDPGK